MSNEVQANGWTAVPVSGKQIIEAHGPITSPVPLKLEDVYFPSEYPVVAEAQSFAKKQLSPEAYNHSMRVYYWGHVIAKQLFPQHAEYLSPSTWALTCMLHDIGTAEAYFRSTRMSFDIYGGIIALEVLKTLGSSHDQAEAVAEAIVRHQDMGVTGTITLFGQLIQLATLYDNTGKYEGVENFGDLVHEITRDSVNKAFPRLGWCSWFADAVRGEVKNKPWCHTTHIPRFDKMMEENSLHRRWE